MVSETYCTQRKHNYSLTCIIIVGIALEKCLDISREVIRNTTENAIYAISEPLTYPHLGYSMLNLRPTKVVCIGTSQTKPKRRTHWSYCIFLNQNQMQSITCRVSLNSKQNGL